MMMRRDDVPPVKHCSGAARTRAQKRQIHLNRKVHVCLVGKRKKKEKEEEEKKMWKEAEKMFAKKSRDSIKSTLIRP